MTGKMPRYDHVVDQDPYQGISLSMDSSGVSEGLSDLHHFFYLGDLLLQKLFNAHLERHG